MIPVVTTLRISRACIGDLRAQFIQMKLVLQESWYKLGIFSASRIVVCVESSIERGAWSIMWWMFDTFWVDTPRAECKGGHQCVVAQDNVCKKVREVRIEEGENGWAPCSSNCSLQRRSIYGNHFVGFVRRRQDRPDAGVFRLHQIWSISKSVTFPNITLSRKPDRYFDASQHPLRTCTTPNVLFRERISHCSDRLGLRYLKGL
jgi:hypothetical protein